MDDTVISFLAEIVNSLHPPTEIGLNCYNISIRYEISNYAFSYRGDKHYFLCEQIGRQLYIQYSTDYDTPVPLFKIDLADPTSREKIINIFRTN